MVAAGGRGVAGTMPAVEGGVRGEGVRPAVVLLGIAVWLGARALGELGPAEASEPERGGLLRIFSGFLGLTLLNPVTSVYFTALILGLRGGELEAGSAKVAFVAGLPRLPVLAVAAGRRRVGPPPPAPDEGSAGHEPPRRRDRRPPGARILLG